MVQIKWLEEAKVDLKEVYDFISRDSIKYARIQVTRIREQSQVLKLHPLAGKQVREISDERIRELVVGRYRLIYRIVTENEIHILLVHHGARELYRRIKDL